MEYKERLISNRKELVDVANEILKDIKSMKNITIVWGTQDTIEFLKKWKQTKSKVKMTDKELNKGIFDVLKKHYKIGE